MIASRTYGCAVLPRMFCQRLLLISTLTVEQVAQLIKSEVIVGGMIPKVTSCVKALQGGGVHKTHIVDARLPHALLLEFFTDQGVGTQILK